VRKREVAVDLGSVEEALKDAAPLIEAEYEWPFQSHASMGTGPCGGADQRR
jgi:hypothetical protein